MKAGVLAVCGLLGLAGCVPLPLEGDISHRSVPTVGAGAALRPAEQVVVLGGFGTRDDDDVPECLRDELAHEKPPLRFMDPAQFRSTFAPHVFAAPWPDTVAAMTAARDRPAVKALAAEHRLRYVIVANAKTTPTSSYSTGGGVPFAIGTTGETTAITARLWDMSATAPPLTLRIETAAEGKMLFVGIGGFMQIPMTETPACKEMARQIGALLAGRQAAMAGALGILPPVEPGAQRSEIERALGSPVNTIRQGDLEEAIYSLGHGGRIRQIEVRVLYAPDGEAIRIFDEASGIRVSDRFDEVFRSLDAASQFRIADDQFWLERTKHRMVSATSWRLMCEMAQRRYPQAMRTLAEYYVEDRDPDVSWPTAAEDVTAYMWYRLAAVAGDSYAATETWTPRLSKRMTATEIERAESMAAEWSPGPCVQP